MSDKSQDELRKRFDRAPDSDNDEERSADEENKTDNSDSSNPSGTSETDEMDERDKTDNTNERSETNQSQGQSSEGLKGRKQVAMYLPADLRGELSEFYEELDARSTLAGEGGLQKNREFYEGMVAFVLDHRQAFADSLEIEIDDE